MNPPWHSLSMDAAAARLHSDPQRGLVEAEAQHRLEQAGPNSLTIQKEEPFWVEFLEELREPMVLLLLFTGGLYAIWGEIRDAVTIFLVILTLNSVEVFNERRAKKAIQALRKLSEPEALILRRDEPAREIPVEQIVPGDLVLLRAGRRVPADARLVESYGLALNESLLTGESLPVEKEASGTLPESTSLADRQNMVFAGTLVVRGHGSALVTATGMSTELGRITGLAHAIKEPPTPLQKAMGELSGWLVWLALGFSLLVPLLGVLLAHQPLKTMLLTGLSLAFATIPEEMPIIISMVLGLGAYRLSKQHAIARRLKVVETLGAVTIIATDKTGTLTHNQMEVSQVYPASQREQLLEAGALSTSVTLFESREVSTDPIDTALLEAALHNKSLNLQAAWSEHPLVTEYTFDNARKRMSTVRAGASGTWIVTTKGAPEAILAVCTAFQAGGGARPLSERDREEIFASAREMAAQGLRLIAIGMKACSDRPLTQPGAESDLVLLGLVGLLDPARPEARQAIETCRKAGIRTVMVTGDHPLTAQTIARQVGFEADEMILTGPQIDALSDADLQSQARQVSIYARTTPEQKLRIVRALQKNGEVVAVTGDGINDAPALVAADIGVAMGSSGSDVAREAADLVLADDNFRTIANAVAEGRVLYENLKKCVRYYLACKVALVSIALLPVLLQIPVPFAPIQIILMELFMDLAAAATFVAEPGEKGLMDRPPRDPQAPFMDRGMLSGISSGAAGLFAAVSGVYLLAWYSGAGQIFAQSAAFAAWMIGHVLLGFNMRSERQPVFAIGVFRNRLMLLWGAAAGVFILLVTLLPGLQAALKTTALPLSEWVFILAAASAGTFWLEIKKRLTFRAPQ